MEIKKGEIKKKENLKSDKKMIETVSKKINRHFLAVNKKSYAFRAIYLFGLVGWEIGIPLVAMAYMGLWLDKNYPNTHIAWALNCIIIGFIIGAYNSYRWIKSEKLRLDKEDMK
ncbi:MAG: AtpZ/AtpI family protein [bacterium]|nr:AtpZ/AtpI family protein [bacterium]